MPFNSFVVNKFVVTVTGPARMAGRCGNDGETLDHGAGRMDPPPPRRILPGRPSTVAVNRRISLDRNSRKFTVQGGRVAPSIESNALTVTDRGVVSRHRAIDRSRRAWANSVVAVYRMSPPTLTAMCSTVSLTESRTSWA